MAQSRAESTRDIYNYGQYINQFPPNTIKAIRQYERIQKEICRQKMSIMFNEICINEEMPPIYIYIYIYIGSLNIHGTHVTANNSNNNNAEFFFASDLKIVYYKNY